MAAFDITQRQPLPVAIGGTRIPAHVSASPTASIITRFREIILATFDVTGQEAQQHAYVLAALSEGVASEFVRQHDLSAIVKVRLGGLLPWRDPSERDRFHAAGRAEARS